MSFCCPVPSKTLATDQNKIDDACCLVAEAASPARAECPISKTSSHKVQRRTLEHLLKPEKVAAIQNVQYYYCTDPNCKVVYFSNDNVPYFTVEDVTVKVFAKDAGDTVHVCYCFDWTRERIKNEIAKTGTSSAAAQIAREIKAGNCACDIKNPKGECCLGDVNMVVKHSISGKIFSAKT
jgi:hypothetical protein